MSNETTDERANSVPPVYHVILDNSTGTVSGGRSAIGTVIIYYVFPVCYKIIQWRCIWWKKNLALKKIKKDSKLYLSINQRKILLIHIIRQANTCSPTAHRTHWVTNCWYYYWAVILLDKYYLRNYSGNLKIFFNNIWW